MSKQDDILAKHFGEQIVGGRLSEMATYSDLFNRMTDAIFLTDLKEGQILECNPASEDHLGLNVEELLGQDFLEWIDPSDQSTFKTHLDKAAEEERTQPPFDVRILTKQKGIRIFELVLCRLRLSDYCEVNQIIAKDVDESRSYQHALQELSTKDPMTGIPNYRAFEQELAMEHARAERYQTPYSIVFCDVDHFKNYNDQNGHPAGDEVLRRVAAILSQNCRKTDFLARYGGEEFVLIARGQPAEKAKMLAEKLRGAIQYADFLCREKQPLGFVSLSLGVSSYPENGKTAAEVVKAADQAVYRAKEKGRNRVECL